MGQGPQKPDHGGNFFMTPRRVLNSVAWRHLSLRGRAILQVFQSRHDGFNNGHLALAIKDIGKDLGDQAHGANARAVAELIEKGFLEMTAEADRRQGKVREYRLTFIASGQGKSTTPASHDYEAWRPAAGERKKFFGAKLAPIEIAHETETAEIRGNCQSCLGADIALLLDNHSTGSQDRPAGTLASLQRAPVARIGVDLDTLRRWAADAIKQHGYGGQRKLATDAGVPEPVLSRFRAGRSLPEHHRLKLQEACGRALPFKAMAGGGSMIGPAGR